MKTSARGRKIGYRRTTGGRPEGAGFTLIEVLVSMAVLVILILALTRMFVAASDITQRGTTALSRNSAAETAMETIMQDAEGMVVNERLACYMESDYTDEDGFGFDAIWFVTTSSDQDDGRAYQLVNYYVTNQLATNALGTEYMRFQLYRRTWLLATADSYGVDVMGDQRQWWKESYGLDRRNATDDDAILDNVVRFDFYCMGWPEKYGQLGDDWAGDNSGAHSFDSTRGPPSQAGCSNLPPATFDVFLQVTSPEVAQDAGMALVRGVDDETQMRAREMMIRDSSMLLGRAAPIIGAAQWNHPVSHYTD